MFDVHVIELPKGSSLSDARSSYYWFDEEPLFSICRITSSLSCRGGLVSRYKLINFLVAQGGLVSRCDSFRFSVRQYVPIVQSVYWFGDGISLLYVSAMCVWFVASVLTS